MLIEPTALPEVILLTPCRLRDDRGWFSETWNAAAMAEAGLARDWVQDNHSFSARRGTLRGLHFQAPPQAQAKLVRCSHGAVRDVAVDIRAGSPRHGAWVAVELSAENGCMLFVPEGFLHGFLTLTEGAEVQYKCSRRYSPAHDRAVRWDDPALGIDWGLAGLGPDAPILSPKDAAARSLAEVGTPFRREDGA